MAVTGEAPLPSRRHMTLLPRKYENKKATTKLSWDMVKKDSILRVGVLSLLSLIDFR